MIIDRKSKTIVFDVCHNTAEIRNWNKWLADTYTKELLINIINRILAAYSGYTMRMANDPLKLHLDDLISKGKKKEVMVDKLAAIFAPEENRVIILDMLDDKMKELWRKIYVNVFVTVGEAERITGDKVFIKSSRFYYRTMKFSDEAAFMITNRGAMAEYTFNRPEYLILPMFVRRAFEKYFYTPAQLAAMSRPEQKGKIVTADFEDSTIVGLPALYTLYKSGKIQMGRYRVANTVVKRYARQMDIAEFVSDQSREEEQWLRPFMLINGLVASCEMPELRDDSKAFSPEREVKHMYEALRFKSEVLTGTIYYFFDSVRMKVMDNIRTKVLVKFTFDAISHLIIRKDKVTYEDIIETLYSWPELGTTPPGISFAELQGNAIGNSRSKRPYNADTFISQCVIPSMLSVVIFLASVGILRIKYRPAPYDSPSFLSGLVEATFTELGNYSIGLRKTYVNSNIAYQDYFELDADNLMIRALGDNNPYETLLAEYTVPMGARRFRVTEESMMRKCYNRQSLNTRVDNLKSLLGVKMPEKFNEFFKRLLRNSEALTPIENTYYIFSLPPDDRKLQELMVSDPEISSLVERAENFKILVTRQNMVLLSDRLRKHGYLFPA